MEGLIALLAVACVDAPEKRAQSAVIQVVEPRDLVAVDRDDLIVEAGARGADRVVGLGAVHGVRWGTKIGPHERTSCQQAHEIRVGGVAFPRAEFCTTWGRFDAFTASARGIEIDDAYAVAARLSVLLGPSTTWEDRGDLRWSWRGELVAIRLDWTWWGRLRIAGELDEDYVQLFTPREHRGARQE